KVIKELESNVNSLKVRTGIFCTGQQINGDIYFKYIKTEPMTSVYYYDDIFNVFQITCILFNLKSATKKEIESLIKQVESNPTKNSKKNKYLMNVNTYTYTDDYFDEKQSRYFMNDEINKNIDYVSTIYHI